MNIKPEGLALPDCKCFRKKANGMNETIDKISSLYGLDILDAGMTIGLCDEAKDYYVAACIWVLISLLIKRDKEDKEPVSGNPSKMFPIEFYTKQFEETYDRLRPLIMQQRSVYVDGVNIK